VTATAPPSGSAAAAAMLARRAVRGAYAETGTKDGSGWMRASGTDLQRRARPRKEQIARAAISLRSVSSVGDDLDRDYERAEPGKRRDERRAFPPGRPCAAAHEQSEQAQCPDRDPGASLQCRAQCCRSLMDRKLQRRGPSRGSPPQRGLPGARPQRWCISDRYRSALSWRSTAQGRPGGRLRDSGRPTAFRR
jgi:hypothetical protein